MDNFEEIYNQIKDIPGWLSYEAAEILYQYVGKIKKGLIVEIGSYAGRSTKLMALASPESEVIAIDSYVSLFPPDNSINFNEIEKTFQASTKGLKVSLIKGDSRQVGRTWNKPIDFLYVDGDHSYETVKTDINLFVSRVKPGHYIVFDDYENTMPGYGVKQAVDELATKYFDKIVIVKGFALCRKNKNRIKTPLLPGGKVLILGGAGYIGSILSQYLQDQGDQVTVFDNFLYGKATIDTDIRDINKLIPALETADAVVNLAGLSNDPLADLKPNLTWEINYKANEVIAALLKATNKRVIYASSCSVYGFSDDEFDEESILNPVTLYARTKMLSEDLYLHKDIDSIILRFATVYGYSPNPRLDLVVNTMIASSYFNKQITVNGGNQWRPVVHIQDVAQAIHLALHATNNQYQIYNVGSNEQNYQIVKLAELIHQKLPDTQLKINDLSVDKRSYRVNFDRITNDLGFKVQFNINDAVIELYEKFKDGTIKDMQEDKYFRIEFLRKKLI